MEKEKLPLPHDNPMGLYAKYLIKEFAGVKVTGFFGDETPIFKDVPAENEYFVLRLDNHAKDKIHVEACRKAVLYYAELIKDHLPDLSKDLIKRYNP